MSNQLNNPTGVLSSVEQWLIKIGFLLSCVYSRIYLSLNFRETYCFVLSFRTSVGLSVRLSVRPPFVRDFQFNTMVDLLA